MDGFTGSCILLIQQLQLVVCRIVSLGRKFSDCMKTGLSLSSPFPFALQNGGICFRTVWNEFSLGLRTPSSLSTATHLSAWHDPLLALICSLLAGSVSLNSDNAFGLLGSRTEKAVRVYVKASLLDKGKTLALCPPHHCQVVPKGCQECSVALQLTKFCHPSIYVVWISKYVHR